MSNRALTPEEAKAMFAATDRAREEKLARAVDWHTYKKGTRWLEADVQPERCRAAVWGQWRDRQCSRKPTTTILGVGFCRQHAAKVSR